MSAAYRAPVLGRFARRLAGELALHVALATAAGTLLFLVVDFVEVGNRASDAAKSADLARLAAYGLPRVIALLLPATAAIGALTGVGAACRRLEVVAMFAAGAGPRALLGPVVLVGLGWALGQAALVETLAPPAAAAADGARRRLGLPSPPTEGRQTWFKGQDALYRVRTLAASDGSALEDVLILRVAGGRLLERRDAARLRWEDGRWWAEDLVVRPFEGEGPREAVRQARAPLALAERPGDFVTGIARPDRLRWGELRRTTEARERLGRPALEHRMELYERHAAPLAILLALVAGAALALRLGRRQTLAGALGIGAMLGASAWLLGEVGHVMGTTGALPPELAAHVAPALMGAAAGAAWLRVARRGIAEG
jgi:lipopolysaccharide export system permease protein